ncbi:MAG: NAD(P)/FAD-dependent oxidoreductase [Verrucomicrobia bacterium]|nr:NAD(P)/FAD-dependent oxidoreductase [Verrucomicrobiota bacterium]
MTQYDLAVIGGGSAGYAAAATAARIGLTTICIDGGTEVGGLCILRGCMPSKTILESANRFITLRRADEFGLSAGQIGFDAGAIRKRKRKLIAEFAGYRQSQLENGKFEFVRARASFISPNRLHLAKLEGGEQEIGFRTAVIATGSELNQLEIPGLADVPFLHSDLALDSGSVPRSVTILGGGAIALEFTHFYNALGSKVTVIQRSPQFLKEADTEVAGALIEALRGRGVQMISGTKLIKVASEDGEKAVYFLQDGAQKRIATDELFYALGRKAATRGLNLEAAGVELTSSGAVQVNERMQSTQPHVFAAGDVAGLHEVVHIAIEQAVVAVKNAQRLLQGEELGKMDYRLRLFAVFTQPQLAFVGLTEREAQEQNIPIRSASYPFADHGKSLVRGEPEGFVKLIAHDQTREILGGAVVGPEGAELIHEIVVAMYFRASASQLATVPHYHPTLSEIWTYPAEELAS